MVSKVKLGSLLSLLTDYHANGAYKKLKENVELFDEPDYAVMIRTTNFEQGCFDSNLKYISEHAYNFLAKSKVQTGDIIMNKIANAGNSYLMPELNCPVSLAMNLFLLRIDEEKANSTFVYLYLKLNEAYVKSFANGSVTKTITKDAVRNLEIELPDRSIQNYIVKVYMAYTNKLTLNHQTNQTLEQMAQTLFKSWFVDFDPVFDNVLAKANYQLANLPADFPEELHPKVVTRLAALSTRIPTQAHENERLASGNDSENTLLPHPDFPSEFEFNEQLGWVPLGWGNKTIKDFGKVVTGKTPPKNVQDAYHSQGSPFITPTDIDESVFIIETNRRLSESGQFSVKNNKIIKNSICVTCIGSQMGKTVIAPFDSYTNQQINSVILHSSFTKSYLFTNLRNRREEIFAQGSSGSTMPILNKSSFEKLSVLSPNDESLKKFDVVVSSYLDGILQRSIQNKELTKLRDTLLPKLISGELQIPDLEPRSHALRDNA